MSSPGEAYASRNNEPSARPESTTGLATLLTVDRVQLGCAVRDWREALQVASSPLVRNGDLAPEYVDAMIRMVETIGPYIVVAPGVALAHARPENGVSRVCISIAALSTPVDFGSINDPVWLICVFGATDSTSHVILLRQLASLLSDERDVAALRAARTPGEVLGIVRKRFP